EPAGGDGEVGDPAGQRAHALGPHLGARAGRGGQAGEDDVEEERAGDEDVERVRRAGRRRRVHAPAAVVVLGHLAPSRPSVASDAGERGPCAPYCRPCAVSYRRSRVAHHLSRRRPGRGRRRQVKLTIVGGGGFRVPQIFQAISSADARLRVTELWLYDTSPQRLDVIGRVLDQLAATLARPP